MAGLAHWGLEARRGDCRGGNEAGKMIFGRATGAGESTDHDQGIAKLVLANRETIDLAGRREISRVEDSVLIRSASGRNGWMRSWLASLAASHRKVTPLPFTDEVRAEGASGAVFVRKVILRIRELKLAMSRSPSPSKSPKAKGAETRPWAGEMSLKFIPPSLR